MRFPIHWILGLLALIALSACQSKPVVQQNTLQQTSLDDLKKQAQEIQKEADKVIFTQR